MYKYKVFMPESRFWVEKEEEIRALAEDVNKAIEIVVRRWRSLWPFAIFPIDVSGGCHERDTGYEAFSGGSYPFYDRSTERSWVDCLTEDFRKEEKEKLDGCKRNIVLWNTKEEWSICRYIGEDDATLHHGGYYYWPAMAADPQSHGVIDDEECTNYGYPTDADLWEIIADPTGMAHNRIYGGEEAAPKIDCEALLAKINQITPEDLETFRMLGSEEP